MGLRVAVAGGGLGGLCLAQGLLRQGVEVTVYEREPAVTGRRQGYRLHLDALDAGKLSQALSEAPDDEEGLLTAIGEYEADMRDYGYAAVEASNQAAGDMAARRSSLMFWLYRRLARR